MVGSITVAVVRSRLAASSPRRLGVRRAGGKRRVRAVQEPIQCSQSKEHVLDIAVRSSICVRVRVRACVHVCVGVCIISFVKTALQAALEGLQLSTELEAKGGLALHSKLS